MKMFTRCGTNNSRWGTSDKLTKAHSMAQTTCFYAYVFYGASQNLSLGLIWPKKTQNMDCLWTKIRRRNNSTWEPTRVSTLERQDNPKELDICLEAMN